MAVMEADWEMELGAGAPVIDATWAGKVDLCTAPEHVDAIAETRLLPGLADALVWLNGSRSPVWTAKCDVWRMEEGVDAYELAAQPEEISIAMACYIDLLSRGDQQWSAPESMARVCRGWVECLRAIALLACRVDLVVRQALIPENADALGVTAYITGCGADEQTALKRLTEAVTAFANMVSNSQNGA